jgi:hypothetical protein
MEENKITQSLVGLEEKAASQPLAITKEKDIPKPALQGLIYGEIAFWIMIVSLVISIPGFIVYLISGGYLDSASVLTYLWQGSDPQSIWENVGHVSSPLSWTASIGMLFKGDMLATLGIAVAGFAAVIGMWGVFIATLRTKGIRIYIVFSLIIAVVLTLSAFGILKVSM